MDECPCLCMHGQVDKVQSDDAAKGSQNNFSASFVQLQSFVDSTVEAGLCCEALQICQEGVRLDADRRSATQTLQPAALTDLQMLPKS